MESSCGAFGFRYIKNIKVKRINKACRENGRRQSSSSDVAVRDGVLDDSWNARPDPFHDIFCRLARVITRKCRYYYTFKTKQKWAAVKSTIIHVIIVMLPTLLFFSLFVLGRARHWCVHIVLYRFIAVFRAFRVLCFSSTIIDGAVNNCMFLIDACFTCISI